MGRVINVVGCFAFFPLLHWFGACPFGIHSRWVDVSLWGMRKAATIFLLPPYVFSPPPAEVVLGCTVCAGYNNGTEKGISVPGGNDQVSILAVRWSSWRSPRELSGNACSVRFVLEIPRCPLPCTYMMLHAVMQQFFFSPLLCTHVLVSVHVFRATSTQAGCGILLVC